jgi:aspartate carbamoyltransferase regulatory subunit
MSQNTLDDLRNTSILQNISDDLRDSSIIRNLPDNLNKIIGVKNPRSIVHNYFTLDKKNNKYKCNHCDKTYQAPKDRSISTLKKHLQLSIRI